MSHPTSYRVTPLIDPERGPAGHRLAWLAADADGSPAGSAFLRLFTAAGQQHLAELAINVHPTERRRGAGSRLLDAAVTAARADSRRCVIAQAREGQPGDHFLAARGFRRVMTLTYARLALAEADPAALDSLVEAPHPGYRLISWDGTVPDELAETFTASRSAMDDMPMEGTDFGRVVWDVDRVRAAAAAVARRGELLETVAAVHAASGEIVGFTELVVPAGGVGDAQHYGTGVLPEHRGRGLAVWMKAESIRRARERHPELAGLLTDTAGDNPSMRSINDGLGYRATHRTFEYQLDL
ncbi:GNAT family N-acetyltransferase [Kitasatospora sp. LaBMicrA B282]|uniref:GNAT family N-acetyltransferase n=1 Tax=Kitasatospora sp. LaBMicrA B282 TaxID=3420949 RepID=UPI003D0C0DC8